MKDFVSYFFKGGYYFLVDIHFRTLVRLFFLNIFKKRHTSYNVSINGYSWRVVDFKSFIYQYQEIFFNRFYDFKTSDKAPVIYDCGANIGLSTLFFSSKFPDAKIHAFEPSPLVFKALEQNIKSNKIANVQLYSKAIWVKNETLEFNEEGADAGSIYAVSDTKKIKVDAVSLLEILDKESKIHFVKMDIEGAENDVLPHIQPAMYKIDNMFIEYHSYNNAEQKLDELLSTLRKEGFRYFIRHVNDRKNPFINKHEKQIMDMQLNIFAYK